MSEILTVTIKVEIECADCRRSGGYEGFEVEAVGNTTSEALSSVADSLRSQRGEGWTDSTGEFLCPHHNPHHHNPKNEEALTWPQ